MQTLFQQKEYKFYQKIRLNILKKYDNSFVVRDCQEKPVFLPRDFGI